ncbi:endonuclease/exonuclease/phosphatase family protein [Bacteriovorax sp. DB6_IX]|uniref:endonuclease/exonuclease/phosphatase family protein n=1 Tax=Bacteriovorax sp. DB6_IX TaxID=1353530 RepID=UPI00038A2F32|nr:endonuclease/exonuclease/phosphatase family protein [Bacteriovorax sp. DB6_IX]EQC50413.1 endonuclease/exonuclease/phosphatase family protein [Bacteriovorax sp. DB6_IX]
MNRFKASLLTLLTFFTCTQAIALIHRVPKDKDVIKKFTTGQPANLLSHSDEFKIVVWNMYKGQNETWEEDFKELAQDTNLLITQEMHLNKKMEQVFKTFGDFEYNTATSFYMYRKDRTGVATISDSPATYQKFLRTRNREPVVRTPKVVLITKYPLVNGEELLVANIHAINFVSAEKLRRQIDSVANQIKKHTGPVIFAGDFNTWSDKKQSYMRTINKMVGLTEAQFEGKDDRMKFRGKKLDYIFYRGLNLKSAKVLGEVQGSDHKPLIATFSIQ